MPLSPALIERLTKWKEGSSIDPAARHSALALFLAEGSSHEGALLARLSEAHAAGHHAVAMAALRHLAERQTRPGEPLLLLVIWLLRSGDPEAGSKLRDCLAGCVGPSPLWVGLGDLLLERKQREAALICLAKGPPDGGLALRCGLLARDMGQRRAALDWFKRCVSLEPLSERGWFLLGTCAQDEGDFDLAIEAYRTVLRINPARTEAEVNLGMSLQQAGDLQAAKRSYSKAYQAKPDTFGRIAQALPGAANGELWLNLGALRKHLAG